MESVPVKNRRPSNPELSGEIYSLLLWLSAYFGGTGLVLLFKLTYKAWQIPDICVCPTVHVL